MIERREDALLLAKPAGGDRVDEIPGAHLDRDELLEAIIVAGAQIDDTHAAPAELPHDPVSAESRWRDGSEGRRLRGFDHDPRGLGNGEDSTLHEASGPFVGLDEGLELMTQADV